MMFVSMKINVLHKSERSKESLMCNFIFDVLSHGEIFEETEQETESDLDMAGMLELSD